MKELPDGCVDAVVTDPPYGISLSPQRGLTDPIANDGRDDAKRLWASFVPEAFRVARADSASLFFSGWSEVWVKDLLAEYFTVKACVVWVKNVWGIGYYTRPQHEFAWYCHKGKPPTPDEPQSDVWNFPREMSPLHSCQKPVALLKKAVRFCAPEGAVILDPFLGSGTTAVACKETGRHYIGIEIEPKYCDIARRRVAEATPSLFAKEAVTI